MYLRRKIDQFLVEWKNREGHLPLVIRGPRQVGKTCSVREFAKKNYKNFVEINFVEQPEFRRILDDGYRIDKILQNISFLAPDIEFIPHETLLFFDEFQTYADLATALKFFAQDGRFDVICSGSLLGLNYRTVESNSVGYKEDYQVLPLDFEEFLWTQGYRNDFVVEIQRHMLELEPFSDLLFDVLRKVFFNYSVTGGMPAVVAKFVEKNNFSGVLELQKQLLKDYEEDIRKYAIGVDQGRILNTYRAVVPQLAKENKKFQISKIAKGAGFANYRGCIEWLIDAGVVLPCRCLQFPELPLGGNYEPDKLKLYLCDIGLLLASLDKESQEDFRNNRNFGIYKGALFENMVAMALHAAGNSLYYYRKENSTLEMDFFVRNAKELFPVEVKSQSSKAKSLRSMITNERYKDIRRGIKLGNLNIGNSNDILTFPYFCTFLLHKVIQEI